MVGILCLKVGRETGTFYEKFPSSDGEEYLLQLKNNIGYYQGLQIYLEWRKKLNLFIRVKLYNLTSATYAFQKTVFVDNSTSASVAVRSSYSSCDNDVLFISVVQCKYLRNCVQNLPSLNFGNRTVTQTVKRKKMEPVVERNFEELSRDLKGLLQTGNLTDITLSDGTTEIRAHKVVLSARSPVFARMLQHEMMEKIKNVITINDIAIDVLHTLLGFMYTGEVEIKDMKMAINLYVAADKYDVRGLKEVCSQMLKEVDLENVLEVIILADLHQDKLVKEAALNFIFKHYSQVKALEAWEDFLNEKQSLAIEILSSVVDKVI